MGGAEELNGLYERMDPATSKPVMYNISQARWFAGTDNRPWFRKNGGGCIYWWSVGESCWQCCDSDGCICYLAAGDCTGLPPTEGWKAYHDDDLPVPTFQLE